MIILQIQTSRIVKAYFKTTTLEEKTDREKKTEAFLIITINFYKMSTVSDHTQRDYFYFDYFCQRFLKAMSKGRIKNYFIKSRKRKFSVIIFW